MTHAQIPVKIRTALLSEQRLLEDIQTRASLANPGDRPHILANPGLIAIPSEQFENLQVHVAECGGTLLGFSVLIPLSDNTLEIDGLFVEPDWWRKGIATALLNHCTEIARGTGAYRITVLANPHALSFYQASEFQIVCEEATRFGPAFRMQKSF